MGQFGPLVSLALGRSPYDDVVPGEGESDLSAPPQLYDERGRPVNPETRRMNREIIRAHNEVMTAIGVAEPENDSYPMELQVAWRRNEYEDRIGRRLLRASRIVDTVGLWGVNGMRQRILIYKQHAAAPFWHLLSTTLGYRWVCSNVFPGLPSFLASTAIEEAPIPDVRIRSRRIPFLAASTPEISLRPLATALGLYVGTHLDIFTFLQRVGIAPSTAIFPNWRFFIPGSSLSPISTPPFPSSVSRHTILGWLGACAIGVMPLAAFVIYRWISKRLTLAISDMILRKLPFPGQDVSEARIMLSGWPVSQGYSHWNRRDTLRDETTSQNPQGQPQGGENLAGRRRRQSTVSVRGDDFASEDEDEGLSTTLISFDVEPTETTDTTTAGLWSAELRPNPLDSKALAGRKPTYRKASLYRLLPVLGADSIAVPLARLILAPFELQVLLGMARLYCTRLGLPIEPLHDTGFLQISNLGGMVNVLGLELLLMHLQQCTWTLAVGVAEYCVRSNEEWEAEIKKEKENEEKLALAQQLENQVDQPAQLD